MDEEREFMLGQLTAAVINFSMRGPAKPFKASDFVLHRRKESIDRDRPKRRSRAAIADEIRGLFTQIGKKVGMRHA